MKVEVLCSINSGQYDKGDTPDLKQEEAQALIDAGHAILCKGKVETTEPKPIRREIPEKPKPPSVEPVVEKKKPGRKPNKDK